MANYWAERLAKAQTAITDKNTKQVERQLAKYYTQTSKKVINDFEKLYNKLLAERAEGIPPTPADLYKLDTYWQLQGQMKNELTKLGNKQIKALSKAFQTNYFEVYFGLALDGDSAFNTLDTGAVQQMLNSIWVADGKTFKERVWGNTERLIETLNEELTYCVATGRDTTDLKRMLAKRFNVSFGRANTLVRTELCHIHTMAAQQRYKDYGIEWVEVLVDADDKTCDKCKELIGKKFSIYDVPPLPVHPNERCALVPVVEY